MKKQRLWALLLAATLLLASACSGDSDDGIPPDLSEAEEDPVIIETDEPEGEPEIPEPDYPVPEMTVEEATELLQADEQGVYAITTADHLVALSVLVSAGEGDYARGSYRMRNNIRMTEDRSFPPIGGGDSREESVLFEGSFDGGNYILYNLTVTRGAANAFGTGLFGAVGPGGSVRNLHLVSGRVIGNEAAAGVAGYCAGTLENCSYNGEVSSVGEHIGSMAGLLEGEGARISACFTNTEVSGNGNTGGFAGTLREGARITDCYAMGKVTAVDSPLTQGPRRIGGFLGSRSGGVVQRCYSSTEVYTKVASQIVGGFMGYNEGSILQCYYNGPAVEHWQAVDANAEGEDTEYDLTPCTPGDLRDRETFQGWDFDRVWDIREDRSQGMPHLRAAWEDEEGEEEAPAAEEPVPEQIQEAAEAAWAEGPPEQAAEPVAA